MAKTTEDPMDRINRALLENTLAIQQNTESSNTRMGNVNTMIENLIKITGVITTEAHGYKEQSDKLIEANMMLTANNKALLHQLASVESEKSKYWQALQDERKRFDDLLEAYKRDVPQNTTQTSAPYVKIDNK